MKVKFVSDFHAEFWGPTNPRKFQRLLDKYLPAQEDDSETILCCAGDMGTFKTYENSYKPLLRYLGRRFKQVVIVPGNHSWYSSVGIWDNEAKFWGDKTLPKNVHYLDNGYTILDGVVFIGSCLWSDFNGADPVALYHASHGMNDYHTIKTGYRAMEGCYYASYTENLTPEATVERHKGSVAFIEQSLKLFRGHPCVVVTHHAPSYQSVQPEYKGQLLTGAFVSDLDDMILHYEPLIWHHGHTHFTGTYHIGKTEVICNCLGYHPHVERKFDANLVRHVDNY